MLSLFSCLIKYIIDVALGLSGEKAIHTEKAKEKKTLKVLKK